MKEIKFRAWDGQKMIAPSVNMLIDSYDGRAYWQFGYDEPDLIPDAILMQYTGLKDKNGREIYEGDVVRITGKVKEPQLIGYDVNQARFCFCYDTGEPMRNINPSEIELLEVIGNIYEKPELLN